MPVTAEPVTALPRFPVAAPVARPVAVVVAGLAGLALVAAPALETLLATRPVVMVTGLVTGAALVLAGGLMRLHPRTRRTAWGCLLTGVLWPGVLWPVDRGGWLPLAGFLLWGALWALLGVALVAYPADQPRQPAARWLVGLTFVTFVPANLGLTLISRPEWNGLAPDAHWPTLVASQAWFDATSIAYGLVTVGLAVFATWVMMQRVRAFSGMDRSALRPGGVPIGLGAVVAGAGTLGQLSGRTADAYALGMFTQSLALLAIPVATVFATVRIRTVGADVGLMIRLLAGGSDPDAVRDALRATLRDPGLEVLYRRPGRAGLVDGGGRPAVPADDGRLRIPVTGPDQADLAVVYADPRVWFHRELVEASVSAAGLALENARLQADLRARLADVSASRARILQVQLAERRRIERDLHDGAQQHLLALALRVEAARVRTEEPETAAALGAIRGDLQSALQEIRELAQGLHPVLLAEAGLARALEPVVERLPLPVFVDLPPERFPAATETVAYLVVCEALAAAATHPQARRVRVQGRRAGRELLLEVAHAGPVETDELCPGLAALLDRVQAMGGRLDLCPGPDGTTIAAALPAG